MPVTIWINVFTDISVDFLDLVIDPFVNLQASDISEEDKGSFEGIPHGVGSSV